MGTMPSWRRTSKSFVMECIRQGYVITLGPLAPGALLIVLISGRQGRTKPVATTLVRPGCEHYCGNDCL